MNATQPNPNCPYSCRIHSCAVLLDFYPVAAMLLWDRPSFSVACQAGAAGRKNL